MPIYEFYCLDCHRIFNFLSRRADTRARPDCPRCGRPKLERKVSLFAVSKGLSEESGADEMPDIDIDEAGLERVMESLAREAENIDEDDPREAGRLMRKLFDATGLELGPGMDEAIRRMEAGEDPEKVEAEMGDVLEDEDPLGAKGKKVSLGSLRRKVLPPSVDETLYDL
jgi:putative FmdB family regulatory protein